MKKVHFISTLFYVFLCIGFLNAQVTLTVAHTTENNIDAEINSALGSTDIETVTTLKITGDANLSLADCHVIRDRFKEKLFVLDLSGAKFQDNEIPDGATDEGAFAAMKIEDVFLPQNLISVGNRAFYECRFLYTADMPNTVTRIGQYGFYKCTSLEISKLPDNLKTLEGYAFQDCSAATIKSLPAGLEGTLSSRTFQNCPKIEISEIPSGITALGGYVFQNCLKIASMTFPAGLISIGNRTFNGCTGLKDIYFKGNTPPTTSTDATNHTFNGVTLEDIIVHVPVGTTSAFNAAPWSQMKSIVEYTPSSNKEVNAGYDLSIYPNPTKGKVNISLEKGILDYIELFDLSGRTLKNIRVDSENAIDISDLSKGIYFIKIQDEVLKIIKE